MANIFATKPVEFENLLQKINRLLIHRQPKTNDLNFQTATCC